MRKLEIYQVDAFTDQPFGGNPAAVCPLPEWLDDDILQNIAMENNLSETAFYVQRGEEYELRWFTPTVEVDLCGHATLATAYVLFYLKDFQSNVLTFHSRRSGVLTVTKNEDMLTLNFPKDEIKEVELTREMIECFSIAPKQAFKGKTDYLFIFESERQIKELIPNIDRIARLEARGVIVSAPGESVDFVSRFFGPQAGVDEDPVTGSAHTTLVPYWSVVFNKNNLKAHQLSKRKGYLTCKDIVDRVEISGMARLYLRGEIIV